MDYLKEKMNQSGISYDRAYWDIDRGSYLYFDKAHINDTTQIVKAAGLPKTAINSAKKGQIWAEINTTPYDGGRAENFIRLFSQKTNPNEDKWENQINGWLKSEQEQALRNLRSDYAYKTSRNVVEEYIRSNEIQFNENGTTITVPRSSNVQALQHGGMVHKTGFAKLHQGELVIPKRTLQRTMRTKPHYAALRTNSGQGGWFRERRRHSIAARRRR